MLEFSPSGSEPELAPLTVIHLTLPPSELHDSESHVRIRIARLRIFLLVHRRVQRHPVRNWIGRNLLLVHLEKRDLLSIRRPEIIAARVQLFLVNPVDFTVQQIVVAIFGQRPLVSAAQRPSIQVVLANVRDATSIRRELGVLARLGARSNLHRSAGIQRVKPKLALRIEEQMFGIGRPMIRGDRIALRRFLLALVLHGVGGWRQSCQPLACNQYSASSGGDVHETERALLAAVVALHEGNLRSVRTPLNRLRSASKNAGILKYRLDRQLFRGLGFLRRNCGGGLGEHQHRREQAEDECGET